MAGTLVKTTGFENLVSRISAKSIKDADFETTVVKPQREIIKVIISVYWFLRTQLKLHYRPITIDEFESTEYQLREAAQLWVGNFWNFVFKPRRTSAWKYYLKFGYFPLIRTPFGSEKWEISSLLFDCYWNVYPKNTDHVYEYGILYHNFDPRSVTMHTVPWLYNEKLLVPPNIGELVEKLYEERRKDRTLQRYPETK